MEERLDHEILFDIFSSRLPMKSLLRLRCTSSSMRNMIDDPCFVTSHITRAYPKQSGQILLMDSYYNNLSHLREDARGDMKTSLLSECPGYKYGSFDLYNSCNGLLCFSCRCKNSVFVLNPITIKKEILKLSPPSQLLDHKYVCQSYGLGHDPSTNKYKVIRLYFYFLSKEIITKDMKDYNVEIHTLGTSSWRTITARPPYAHHGRPVFAYGALHWKSLSTEDVLISFDMANEVFYLTPHPKFRKFQIVDLGGCLGMVDLSYSMRIEIWLLKDCCGNEKKREWVKEYKIDIQESQLLILGIRIPINTKREVVGIWESGEILIQHDNKLISYNPKTDRLRDIFELNKTTKEAHVYRESLVSLASFK